MDRLNNSNHYERQMLAFICERRKNGIATFNFYLSAKLSILMQKKIAQKKRTCFYVN